MIQKKSSVSIMSKAVEGVTLIELMIAIAIVAIIASIAIPSFTNQNAKTRRIEAKTALSELATQQQIFFAQFNRYTDVVSSNAGLGYGSITSKPDGIYVLTARACEGGSLNTCFVVQAEAIRGGQVKNDPNCRFLTLDNTGVTRSSTTATGEVDTTAECW